MIFLLLALAGLSAAQDCSACPSCVQANNPTFDKQCAVDIVFVLDETGSIRNSQNGPEEVRSGSRSFFSALSQIKGIGGVANIAIVEFGRRGVIARWRRQDNGNPGTLDHDDTCMYPATPENVRDLDYYIKGDIRGAEGYRPGTADSCGYGTTGWAGALETVYTTPWRVCDENGNRRKNPDIVIWFTDGNGTSFLSFVKQDRKSKGEKKKKQTQKRRNSHEIYTQDARIATTELAITIATPAAHFFLVDSNQA